MNAPGPRLSVEGHARPTAADDGRDDLLLLRGPERGPAGDAGIRITSGLVVRFDLAATGVITHVWADLSQDVLGVLAHLIGRDRIDDDALEADATIELPDPAPLARRAGRLALALARAECPLPTLRGNLWPADAAWLAHQLTLDGLALDGTFVAEQLEQALPALVQHLTASGGRRTSDDPLLAVARLARDAVHPESPMWVRLDELLDDQPASDEDLIALMEGTTPIEMLTSPRTMSSDTPSGRRRGSLVWSDLGEVAATVVDRGFGDAVEIDPVADGVEVSLKIIANASNAPNGLAARVVHRATSRVVSVARLPRLSDRYVGFLRIPDDAIMADHRVEVLDSLGHLVRSDADVETMLGEQWGVLALDHERAARHDEATQAWLRSSDHHYAAGNDARAAQAEAYANENGSGRPRPARMLGPFLSERPDVS